MRVEFHSIDDRNDLKFVVIQSKYKGKWVFVRHKSRKTWEIPGGHIEAGEIAEMAAERELKEETGAIEFRLIPICDYCVCRDDENSKSFGRLFYADIKELGELGDYEIEEITLVENIPSGLTYPQIQPFLYDKVIENLSDIKYEVSK